MKKQEIKLKNSNFNYSIIIGENILGELSKRVKLLCPKTKKIAFIFDKNVPVKFKMILKNKLKNYELTFLYFSANENKIIKICKFIP